VLIVSNASQVMAMYSLVMFYRATSHELSEIKPLYKFASVKAIVFFTFWQVKEKADAARTLPLE